MHARQTKKVVIQCNVELYYYIFQAKFTSGNSPNGDARIDVGPVPTFSGLNKEELMKFSNDPYWIKVRWILFIFFW